MHLRLNKPPLSIRCSHSCVAVLLPGINKIRGLASHGVDESRSHLTGCHNFSGFLWRPAFDDMASKVNRSSFPEDLRFQT